MQLLKKLSAKDIMGPVNAIVMNMEIDETIMAYGVAGTCSAYETGTSTFGEWNRFVGEFEAINYVTGETIRAPKAHVPEVLEGLLMDGISDTSEVESAKSTKTSTFYRLKDTIEFAYEVKITRLPDDEKGGISYKYTCVPKVEFARNDNIGHLTKLLSAPVPAPTPDAKKAKPAAKEKA